MDPHPLLTAYYRTAEDKQRFLRAVFDDCAPHYERIIRWGSLGTGQRYRRQALVRAGLAPGMRVLDVATGTGATARAAVDLTGDPGRLVGVDPSLGMLRESRRRLAAPAVQGVADRLPVATGAFDFVVMGYALRHVESLTGAFGELARVLRPGGKVLLLEVTPPASRLGRALLRGYVRGLLPRLAQGLTGSRTAGAMLRYYWETLAHMVAPAQVVAALEAAGFARVGHRALLGVFSEYEGTRPGAPPAGPRPAPADAPGTPGSARGAR